MERYSDTEVYGTMLHCDTGKYIKYSPELEAASDAIKFMECVALKMRPADDRLPRREDENYYVQVVEPKCRYTACWNSYGFTWAVDMGSPLTLTRAVEVAKSKAAHPDLVGVVRIVRIS